MRLRAIDAVLLAVLAVLPAAARAQAGASFTLPDQVHLDDVHPGVGGERVVDLYLRTLTRQDKKPVENLRAIDLDVRDNGRKVHPDEMTLDALGRTTRGITCVLLLDASPTMGDVFEKARSAATSFMNRLGAYDEVAIVAFTGSARVVAPFGAPRAEAVGRLQRLEVDPNPAPTVLYDAIQLAIDQIRKGADLPRRTLLIVFSDGKDGGSSHTLEQVIESSKGDEATAPILSFAIGYDQYGGEGLDTLRQLAGATGGGFLEATSPRSLKDFYKDIWNEVTQSYVVRFPADMDGRTHTVTVAIGRRSDTHIADYPLIRRPFWHYALPAGLLVGIALAAFLALRLRSPGRLEFVGGAQAGDSVPLRRGTTRIGALPDNDVVISDSRVSRNHAEIHISGKRVEIQDLHSTNGTSVNGMPVQTSPLKPGDKIRIGDADIVFER